MSRSRLTAAALLLFSAVMLIVTQQTIAQWPGDIDTNPDEIEAQDPFTCLCTDSNPRASIFYNVSYTCLQEYTFGNCQQNFITQTNINEVPEGWCQITCGRCPCCASVANVSEAQGLTSLLAAVQSAGLTMQFNAPASQFTLLAPTNDAFTKALPILGYSSLDAIPVSMLQTILYYHIIPPHAAIDALWTTPFFNASSGNGIPTALPGIDLSFASSNGNITVSGASNNATIIQPDIIACKSYINIIDTVLIPPKNAPGGQLPVNAGNIGINFGPAPSAAQQQAATNAQGPIGAATSTTG